MSSLLWCFKNQNQCGSTTLFYKDLWLEDPFPLPIHAHSHFPYSRVYWLIISCEAHLFENPFTSHYRCKHKRKLSECRKTPVKRLSQIPYMTHGPMWGSNDYKSHKYYTYFLCDLMTHSTFFLLWKS